MKNFSILDITKSIAIIAVIAFLWFHGSKIVDSFNKSGIIPKEVIVQLAENKIALENMIASNKEAKALISELESKNGEQADLLSKVKQDNKEKDNKLDEVGIIVAKLKQKVELLERDSDHTYNPDNESLDKYKQYFKKIYAEDTLGNKFPVAWAIFLPNQPEDKQWKTGVYPIEYHVTVVETDSDKGTSNRYAEVHIENNQMSETVGKEYPIALTNIKWEKFENKTKRFYLWNPRLGLASTFATDSIAVGLDLSILSYGRTKRDMDWRFFTVGFGLLNKDSNMEGTFYFEPLSWNFGNVIPLVENMFIGPVGAINTNLDYDLGIKISLPF